MFNHISRFVANRLSKRLLKLSGVFDEEWYRYRYPDLSNSNLNAINHYIKHGAAEGRDPSPAFSAKFYLDQFSNLDPRKVNPLCHYLLVGEKLGAWPNQLFDPDIVSESVSNATGLSALGQVLEMDQPRFRTSAEFDTSDYLEKNPHLAHVGINPLWHALANTKLPPDFSEADVRAITADDLEVTNVNEIASTSTFRDLVLVEMVGDDPYWEIRRKDGQPFKSAHYRLEFRYQGPTDILARSKCYFDSGSGYSETSSWNMMFRACGNGKIRADFLLRKSARSIRFDPMEATGGEAVFCAIGRLSVSQISRYSFYFTLINDLSTNFVDRLKILTKIFADLTSGGKRKATASLRRQRLEHIDTENKAKGNAPLPRSEYADWVEAYDSLRPKDFAAMQSCIEEFSVKPKISVVMPVYNPPEDLLRDCIDSVISQTYENWEFCIADDCSPAPHVRELLEKYAASDPRIKVHFREENGHISKASNSALDLATGEWIALLDHDDLLPAHALFCLVDAVNRRPDAMMIYSDEDKIDLNGQRHGAYHKPDFNYHLFLSHNMFSHLGCYRRDLVMSVGGFQEGMEGSQDYDLALRCLEKIDLSQVVHIPHVLYHWRVIPGSTAMSADEKPYAMIAGERAITAHLKRRGVAAKSELVGYGYQLVIDDLSHSPLVSIIIPTRDGGDVLKRGVDSILAMTDYPNFELILVDNGSVDQQTLEILSTYEQRAEVTVTRDDSPFNFSRLNNEAVKISNGEFICFVNDDIEVQTKDWLTELMKVCELPDVGSVGPRLWYSDETLQHAGLVLSPEFVAMNGHKGLPRGHLGYFGRVGLMHCVSALTAACLVMRKSIFQSIGGFDEKNLAVAYNDVDLGLKILDSGLHNVMVPQVNLTHHESASRGSDASGANLERLKREKNFITKKWGHLLSNDPCYSPNLTTKGHDFSLSFPPRVARPWEIVKSSWIQSIFTRFSRTRS
ncbi:MAG: glycosyltransferase family 2 protein [Pseudomonadota bacterium]